MPSLPATPAAARFRHRAREAQAVVTHDTWSGALWTIVIALDLFWLSNPLLFFTFAESLSNACAVTLVAALITPPRRGVVPPWTVIAVLAYGLMSATWSVHSTFTVKYGLTYVALAAIGLAIAAIVDVRTIAQGMLLGGVVYVVLSLYGWWFDLPGASSEYTGEFPVGVGTNRNIMSYTLVLCLALAVGALPRSKVGRASWLCGTALIGYGLYLAQSATGYVAPILLGAVALVLTWHDRSIRRGTLSRHVPWWVVTTSLAAAAAAALFVLRAVLESTGRDGATFSGRTPLWSATWSALDGSQLAFGAGWGAVWQHPWLSPGPNALHDEIIRRNAGVFQSHGHNSFFEVLPEIGLVGAAVVAAVYALALGHAWALRRSASPTDDDLDASRITIIGVLALLIFGVTEPMSTAPLGWFLLVLLASVPLVQRSRTAAPVSDAGTNQPTDDRPPPPSG